MHDPAPLTQELLFFREPLRLLRHLPRLRRAPRGNATVMVLPGYYTTDRATAPLRAWLASRGHRVSGWGLGRNLGAVGKVLPELTARLEALEPGPVHLVGWSWGGVVARALARAAPERIAQVISLGSPIVGGALHTRFARNMSPAVRKHSAAAAADREATPLTVPALSIYTDRDAVVAWPASIDPVPEQTQLRAVDSTHFGLLLNPTVWTVLAERLAG